MNRLGGLLSQYSLSEHDEREVGQGSERQRDGCRERVTPATARSTDPVLTGPPTLSSAYGY